MKQNVNWIYKVFLLAFIFSVIFSAISSILSDSLPLWLLPIIIIIVITIGIVFDMIGVAVLTANEANIHAKASKKLKGAKESITLLKNATQVSSVCNDVIGDICGIVSGGLATVLTLAIVDKFELSLTITTVIMTAIVSSLTVGFKAVFKTLATKNSDTIVYIVGKIKHILHIK